MSNLNFTINMEEVDNGFEVLDDLIDTSKTNEEALTTNNVTEDILQASNEMYIYSIGKLGLDKSMIKTSKESNLSREEKLIISNEGIGDIINTIITKIKEILGKIGQWFKNIWKKIMMLWMRLSQHFAKVAKSFRYIKNKNDFQISKRSQELFVQHFGIFMDSNFKTITESIKEMFNIPSFNNEFKKLAISPLLSNPIGILKKNLPICKIVKNALGNKQPIFITYASGRTIKVICKDEDKLSYETIEVNDSDINYEIKKDWQEVGFNTMLNMAIESDKLYDNVKVLDKTINNVTSEIEKQIKEKEKKDPNNELREELKSLLLISSKLGTDFVFGIMDNARKLSKCLKNIVNDLSVDSNLMYYELNDKLQAGEVIDIQVGQLDKNDVKLVEDGKKVYFVITESTLVKKDIPYRGGFVINNSLLDIYRYGEDRNNESKDYLRMDKRNMKKEEKIRGIKQNASDWKYGERFANGGVIFLQEGGYKKLSQEFCYYHEEGHVVTGQQETPIDPSAPNYIDIAKRYGTHFTELRSDAYACIKMNIKHEDLINLRLDAFEVTKEEFEQHGCSISEYLNNLKKATQEVSNLAKLSLFEIYKAKQKTK